ncbi:MAG: MATE family efflux transporter [Firmicutes bacterium]|nr:MATE family efflux transporter [Bacillota bacterium]
MATQEEQYKKMTETPISKLVAVLAVPTVISMLVSAIYNSADAYFVSRIGTSASGAVGVVFSLMAIIQAIGFTIGMGSGSIISRLLGEKKGDEASEVASSSLFLGLFFGILIILIMSFKMPFFMRSFGATDTILPYAVSYGRYIVFGAPFMMGVYALNNILRYQGNAKYAMIGITSGAILNIGLDPLLIFTFKMGTAGAALATLLSQVISFFILLSFFFTGKSAIKLSVFKISHSISIYLNIFKTGLPSLARQGFASVGVMLLNRGAAAYGDAAVAAMSIVGKVFMMIFAVMLGIGQGYQPVLGINYGAKKYERVKQAFYFTFFLTLLVACVLGVPVFVLAKRIMTMFTKDDAAVIEYGVTALKAQCFALLLIPINNICSTTLQVTGKSWTATLLSCMRQGVFFIPLILILPKYIGIAGVQYSQPIADSITSICAIPFGVQFLKSLKKSQ